MISENMYMYDVCRKGDWNKQKPAQKNQAAMSGRSGGRSAKAVLMQTQWDRLLAASISRSEVLMGKLLRVIAMKGDRC